jgi:hypothetical protein
VNQQLIVTRREQELLDQLEIIRRNKKRVTVIGFCKLMGYANKSALRHFPVLKSELSLYLAQFDKPRTKRLSPSAVRLLEVQVERMNRELTRFKSEVGTIPKLKVQAAKLKQELKQSFNDKMRLQGMISTLISFLSNSDLAKANDLSVRLEEQARELLSEENTLNPKTEDSSLED